MNQAQFDTHKQVLMIERDIQIGGVKTVRQLLARSNKANLPYSVYFILLNKLRAKKAAKVPMFLRKQAF